MGAGTHQCACVENTISVMKAEMIGLDVCLEPIGVSLFYMCASMVSP